MILRLDRAICSSLDEALQREWLETNGLGGYASSTVHGAHPRRYPGVVHPRGFDYLQEFRLDPFPIFTFLAGGVEIEKRVFMVQGENTTVVEYELRGPDCELELRPLIAFRDFHATTHRNDSL